MNKKLIAIAVASVMAAPVAMADLKISGRVANDFTITNVDGVDNDARGWSDSGQTRLQFDGTMGNAYARIALDERLGRDSHTHDVDIPAIPSVPTTAGTLTTDSTSSYDKTKRDNYIGYKFGNGMTVQAGRMAGAAKNIEKDPYIASFLEIRSTVASSYTSSRFGSSSFIDAIGQLSMKAGGANIKVQLGLSDYANNNNGHVGVSVTGKAGGVNYFASYNNAEANGSDPSATNIPGKSNMKLGGKMKFGTVKVGLMYTSMDNDGATGAGNATNSIFVDGDFALGNGLSANVGYGTRSGDVAADDATFMRLAVMKKLNKGVSVYAGYTATDYDAAAALLTKPLRDTSELGVGMAVKF